MKKFSIAAMFSLLLFTCTDVKAQYIPDVNFADAIAAACPTCIDGSHYLTADAQTLTSLAVGGLYSTISDLTGLDGFTNLQKFTCTNEFILVFPALPPNIDTVIMEWDHITSLPPLPSSLQYLDCYVNDITSLPALPASLTYLMCGRNQLSSLPSLPSSLQTLYCGENQITNLPTLPSSLSEFDCRYNLLISLPDLPLSLLYFGCDNNSITTLPSLPDSLQELYVWGNQLTSLPDLPLSLLELSCGSMLLTSLPPLNSGLKELDCTGSPLLQHLPSLPASLREIYAVGCGLLDLPPLPDTVVVLDVRNNSITYLPALPSLTEYYIDISYNPISCLPYIPPSLGYSGYIVLEETNITCLPNIPNGFYYYYWPLCEAGNLNGCFAYPTIHGNVYADFNNNGTYDSGEYHVANAIVETNPGNYVGISDTAGNYIIGVPLNSIDTTHGLPFSVYYNPPSTYYTVTFDSVSGQASLNNDFGILAVNNGANLDVTMTPARIRSGFDGSFWVTINNPGTTDLDGAVSLTFDPLLTFVSADQGGIQSGNIVTWTFNAFHPFQTKTFIATINCPSSVVIGTILNDSVSGTVIGETDIDLTNNLQSISSTVVGSYDPNDKEVSDASFTTSDLANGKYLEYTIHFQNTGTAPATFINVVDTLSDKLDASSFEMIAASHQYEVTLTNDLTKTNHPVFVKWLFNNIQLPDSSVDFAGSQGFVKFRIRPKNDLLIGDQIQNTAGIYFDFNAPVLTNTAITDVVIANATANVKGDFFRATAYPNPAANTTTIHCTHVTSQQLSLQITDEVGSVMMEKIISVPHESFDVKLDLKKFHSGVYFITLKSLNGVQVMKLVKE